MAVLATGGLGEENKMHDVLYAAARMTNVSARERDANANAYWDEWTQKWQPEKVKLYIFATRTERYLKGFRCVYGICTVEVSRT